MMGEPAITTVSRRSTRLYEEEHGAMMGSSGSRRYSICDEKCKDKLQRDSRGSSASAETRSIPMVDLGKDVTGLFPKTGDEMGQQVENNLQAIKKPSKEKVGGRPLNFGTVLPGAVFRSSFPMSEDFQFLQTLGLKTVVSLVNKEFSPDFQSFMKTNGVRHCVVEMQGTKKVEIPKATMQSIMEVVLNQENHPLLIHCNHGKHRTGCAVAALRLLAGWNVEQIVEEYKGYAEPKVRECDLKYIKEYELSNLDGLFNQQPLRHSATTLTSLKMKTYLFGAAVALFIWIISLLAYQRRS